MTRANPMAAQAQHRSHRTKSVSLTEQALPSRSLVVLGGLLVYLWAIHSFKAPVAAAAITVSALGLVLDDQPVRVPPPLALFGAFIVWGSLGYLTSDLPDLVGDALIGYLKLWLIFFVAINVARSRKEWQRLAIAWLAIFALYPVRGTLFNMVFGISELGRYSWNFSFRNPNDMATLTLPILSVTLAIALTTPKGWFKKAAIAGSVILPIIIFGTQSRGGILALATMMLLVFTHHKRRIQALAMVLCVGGAVAIAAPASVWDRLSGLRHATTEEGLGQVDEYGSADQRYEIWRVARAITADHPVLGVGLGTYPKHHARYVRGGGFRLMASGERDPHSMYLGTSAETGIPGLLLLLGVIGAVLLGARRALKEPDIDPDDATRIRTLAFGLIAFLQASIFATMQHLPFMYLHIALLYSAIEASRIPKGTAVPAPAVPLANPLPVRQRIPLPVRRRA